MLQASMVMSDSFEKNLQALICALHVLASIEPMP